MSFLRTFTFGQAMKDLDSIDTISYDDFRRHAEIYLTTVDKNLQALGKTCREEIPATLSQRKKDGEPSLNKSEVTTLLDWKLSVHICPSSTP